MEAPYSKMHTRCKGSPLVLAAETLKPSLEGQAIGKAIEERKKRRK